MCSIYLASLAAGNYFAILLLLLLPIVPSALPKLESLDEQILECHRLLKWLLPRSNFIRTDFLLQVASLQARRKELSGQKSDLDKAIAHLTEAVLPSPTSSRNTVFAFFYLATLLLSRFLSYRHPDDLKSSIKYLHFIRVTFYPLEAFDTCFDIPITSGNLSTQLSLALGLNLLFNPGDVTQPEDLEDIVTLIPEFITGDILTSHQKLAILAFSSSATTMAPEMYLREDTQRIFNRAIQVLREAVVLNPDLDISYGLAMCLAIRFETTHGMKDCKEAITHFDRVIAKCSPTNNLEETEKMSMRLTLSLLISRVNLSPSPENLEDGIHRLRTFVSYSSSWDDEDRTELTAVLSAFTHKRFQYFGVTGNSGGGLLTFDPRLDIQSKTYFVLQPRGETMTQIQERAYRLGDFANAIMNSETADVETTVEGSRQLITLQKSSDQWQPSSELTYVFAGILLHAYRHTKRLDYLNEAITTFQDLYNISTAPRLSHFHVGCKLHDSLSARIQLLRRRQDFKELMQLSSELANDSSGEVFTRFEMSYFWAGAARVNLLPSASMAYETAMSLLQETLVFCPTLQTQHLRLAEAFDKGENLPSDYASYRIENGQVEQAIETLERGRALIWSEMRGLRTSTDRLRAAYPVLADNLSDINRRLESVTTSVADGDLVGHSETENERSIGQLVLSQRALLDKRNTLITHVQSLPGFEHFLRPPSFNFLNSAASRGPVLIVNHSQAGFSSHIILLLKDSRPFIISTPSGFDDRANQLENELLRVRKEKGLDSRDYNDTLASVLSGLYDLVGKPVIERLRELKVPEKSRVWWCPTGAFCSLPLHAMGPIPSDDGNDLYFSDLYIPSYTPTLAALIESRKRGSSSNTSDNSKPSILLVAQPDTLPGALGEVKVIETTKIPVKCLISAMATPETVIEGLREHRFAHFVCHGLLETGKPFDASLELHKDHLTLLNIVRSQLPTAEFAFLSACHTAELTEGSVADEGLHLAAAMQYCGFRSVVGTMWAMADTDGADLSKHFYKAIFADKADQNGVPYHARTARALQIAMKKLRKKRGVTLERWVNFVHYGA